MATITRGAALPFTEDALSLVIRRQSDPTPPSRGKAAGSGTSTHAKRVEVAKDEIIRYYVLDKGGIWGMGTRGLKGVITSSGAGRNEMDYRVLNKAAGSGLNRVVIEDVLLAARSAESLEFKISTPSMAELLVRLASVLDSNLLPRLAALPKQAFEDSVAAVLRNIAPPLSTHEAQMAQRVAVARAAILEEFGCFTREKLAASSRARDPGGLVDTWRSRSKVFSVPLPQNTAKDADVYPAFQFHEGKPRPIIATILGIFGKALSGWDLAHWFTSGNSMLPDSARPVDLLERAPAAVEAAARFDALPPAA